MDQREKLSDYEEMLRTAIAAQLLDVMTCMPVIVSGWDAATMTVKAQPIHNMRILQQDGSIVWVPRKALVHCPVVFAGGAGFVMTAPPQDGDEALAFFSIRSIDEWFVAGGPQNRADLRSHSISDGFVFVGPRSLPNVLANIHPEAMELRSIDGETTLTMQQGAITLTAGDGISVVGRLAVSGIALIAGTVTAAALATLQAPTASSTASTHSVPIVLDGVTYYMRLSATP